ncbi:MAG: hypothetical protein ACKVS5_09050 [Parvularculaceae bacterium]
MTAQIIGRLAAFCLSALALAATPPAANAQEDDGARAESLRASLKTRAQTILRDRPPEIGLPAREVVESRINWTEMKTQAAISARRDSAARQSVTVAVVRPPGLRAAAADRFKGVRAVEVNRAQVPVLVPEGGTSAGRVGETLKIYAQGDSYSAISEIDAGVSMRISGTRKKLVLGNASAARAKISAMRAQRRTLASVDAPYLITRSDSATDLSFAKFGAGYVLSVMCDDPDTDARCLEDEFIVALASNLMLLNPEAGGE